MNFKAIAGPRDPSFVLLSQSCLILYSGKEVLANHVRDGFIAHTFLPFAFPSKIRERPDCFEKASLVPFSGKELVSVGDRRDCSILTLLFFFSIPVFPLKIGVSELSLRRPDTMA